MTDYIGNYKNRPRRVVFYGRVSTEHEEQLSALGNQMEWYTDLALRNPNWTVVAQYIDEGITGTQMKKRPSFMRMIEHAKEHRFDLIVTRELSRFARNTVDALNATRELKQYGVEVYFVNDGIWTMDGDGEVRLTIMASIAQDESRKTSERVKAGQKMSREKGVLYGSGNIIGYDRVDGTYVINEEQAATVRRIFNLYAEGHGETTVAKMLIEENRKDGGGGLSWTASKVSRVLRKPTYKGYMTYNKSHIDDFLSHNRINHSEENFVLVKGNFEPIVSEELWETCNQIRSKRAAFVKGKDGRAHKFGVSFPQNKWTKILFCDCGMRFQIEGYDKTANGGKNMRLICARSKMFKKKDAARALNGIPCPAPYASEWKLELMAREVFRTVWKENAEDILGLLRMLDANLNTTGTPNDGNQLENKLSALNEELDDLVSQRASRSITIEKVVEKIRFAVLLCIRRFQTSEKVNSVLCCTALGKQRHDWIPRACQDARKHIAWLQSDARQSAGKGCLSGICRGRETHSYNDRSCRGGNTSTALLCRYGMTLDLLFESVNGNIIIRMRNRP